MDVKGSSTISVDKEPLYLGVYGSKTTFSFE